LWSPGIRSGDGERRLHTGETETIFRISESGAVDRDVAMTRATQRAVVLTSS